MKVKNMGQTIVIEAKESYTLDQLFELFQQKGNFEGGVPEVRKTFGISAIFFPGVSGFENVLSVRKKKITLQQTKTTLKGAGKSMALDALTNNWSSIANMEGQKNGIIMEDIAKEIERLVC